MTGLRFFDTVTSSRGEVPGFKNSFHDRNWGSRECATPFCCPDGGVLAEITVSPATLGSAAAAATVEFSHIYPPFTKMRCGEKRAYKPTMDRA